MPEKLLCCSKSHRRQRLEAAYGALAKEVDIVGFIQERRYANLAIAHLLNEAACRRLQQRSRLSPLTLPVQRSPLEASEQMSIAEQLKLQNLAINEDVESVSEADLS